MIDSTYEDKLYQTPTFAGAVRKLQTNELRNTVMLRLRRVARMCSRTISGTAYRFRHGSTLCSPTVEKILCRSLFSKRSHVGNLRQTIQGKGVIHKRVETAGVYPLVRPRGVSALPCRGARHVPAVRRRRIPSLRFSEKLPRPLGANTLTQFEYPAQPVQKRSRPDRANPPTRFVFPAPPAPINKRKKGTRTGAFSIVVRSCDGGGTSYGRSPTDR